MLPSLFRRSVAAIAFAAVFVSAPLSARAELLYRKSSPSAAHLGELSLSKEQVTVTPRAGNPVTIPTDDIARIEWDREPATIKQARADEAAGKLTAALAQYEKDYPNTSGEAQIDTQFLIARTTAKLALTDPSRLDDAVSKLESFHSGHANHFRAYEALEYLGEVYLARGEFDKARAAFDQVEQAASPARKMGARIAKARILQKQGKNDEALVAFDAVIAESAKSPAELSRRYEAMLGRASCLMAAARYGDAVQALDAVIDAVAPTDSRNMAAAYVLKGDCLRALDKQKDALLAYLHVDVLFQHEKPQHAEALYYLSRLWSTMGQQERANDAASRLSKEYPESQWAKKLSSG